MITIDDFGKVELRIADILEAEPVADSEKLVRLVVDVGEKDADGAPVSRQIVAGIRQAYTPEALVGKQIVIVANLEPRTLRGVQSQGMLLAVRDAEGIPILLVPEKGVPPGALAS